MSGFRLLYPQRHCLHRNLSNLLSTELPIHNGHQNYCQHGVNHEQQWPCTDHGESQIIYIKVLEVLHKIKQLVWQQGQHITEDICQIGIGEEIRHKDQDKGNRRGKDGTFGLGGYPHTQEHHKQDSNVAAYDKQEIGLPKGQIVERPVILKLNGAITTVKTAEAKCKQGAYQHAAPVKHGYQNDACFDFCGNCLAAAMVGGEKDRIRLPLEFVGEDAGYQIAQNQCA